MLRRSALPHACSVLLSLCTLAFAQDASTGAVRGTVSDPGGLLEGARVTLTHAQTGIARTTTTLANGEFVFDLVRPGEYVLEAAASGMGTRRLTGIKVDVGAVARFAIVLQVGSVEQTVSVSASTPLVDTQPSAISDLIDERALDDLPLNGRRFTDLTLLTPGVTQDPRGLTSSSNGDLSFGGVRGFNSSYLVDGSDNNNGFFAQARGRYRAPYQFSNEVVQEFRVSSNTYGTELGRSGGAVVNVVTKSGSNRFHGSIFYYLRDGQVGAIHPFVRKKYPDRQNQFGFSIGGPLRKNKFFFFAGYDQHIFHVPTVVQFADGATTVVPTIQDYEATDQALVQAAATKLSTLGGQFRSSLLGSTAFLKIDGALSSRHYLSVRFNMSRFFGANNVFFDPSSPITNFGITENGEERVSTESANLSLTTVLAARWNSHFRVQFSRDLQGSIANSADVLTDINRVIAGFGRSSLLPRRTREHRTHIVEIVGYDGARHTLKFGVDVSLTRDFNYFPRLFGGEFIFDDIRVNPFTFKPQTFGLNITPLRAFAHSVPNFYIQDFGNAVSRPDTNEIAFYVQDTVRITNHLALSLGVRYDRQSFRSEGLLSNPLWPDSGKVPSDNNNFAPRIGFAASFGSSDRPFVLRGGYGMFYTRIPQIYTSSIELQNGLTNGHLFLNNADFFAQQVFPTYPNPLVACTPGATACAIPANVGGFIERTISSFAHDFQIPYVQQASITAEREIARRTAIGVAYLFVTGKHLIRARDVNLPQPTVLQYPVFDDSGSTFTGDFYSVSSFANWRFTPSIGCPFPPCIDPLVRPISSVGAINSYESASSSVYHGMTVSLKRRMTEGLYFRMAYTWAHAIDSGQDSLVAGSPAQVQNTYATALEKGRSVTDQRHRLVFSYSFDPHPFHREHQSLGHVFNDWRFSGVVTMGSGRPVNARISGDSNRDGNIENDRLPGAPRNAFNGPNYFSTDMRITRRFNFRERLRLEISIEGFNVFNHSNKSVSVSDNGFSNLSAIFQQDVKFVGNTFYPGHFNRSSTFLVPTDAYAPRQIQFSVRLKF